MASCTALPFQEAADRVTDWKSFYEEHFGLVWRLLVRFGAPEGDVEDLAQEVFTIAHRRLPGFRWEASPKTWLFGICRRVAAGARRRDRVRRAVLGLLRRTSESATPPSEAAVARRDLLRLLARLPEPQRLALLLHDVDGMSVPEIAETCDCPEATVWSRLRLARNALRRGRREDDDE